MIIKSSGIKLEVHGKNNIIIIVVGLDLLIFLAFQNISYRPGNNHIRIHHPGRDTLTIDRVPPFMLGDDAVMEFRQVRFYSTTRERKSRTTNITQRFSTKT